MRSFIVVTAVASVLLFVGCRSHGAPRAASEPASTLDPTVQRIAREEIERAVPECTPTAAVIVVLDPKTGAILAMEGRDHGKDDPSLAARHAWITGSTLKTFTIAAAIEAHAIDLDARFDCATRDYGSEKLQDASDHGVLSATEILAVSSNVGTSRIYDTLGLDGLVSVLERFHFADPPAELPTVTDPKSLRAAVLAAGELAKATPLQVAAGYAAIFDGGVYHTPSFTRTAPTPERVLRAETAQTMVQMLEFAVQSDIGSGKRARIEGARVAGKTGTAEGGYVSFVGAVLDAKPLVVVLVGIDGPRDGATGPTAAAPTFARVARRVLGSAPLAH